MSAGQTTSIAAFGFKTAYGPEAAPGSPAAPGLAGQDLSAAERVAWDAAWADVRRLEQTGLNTQSLLTEPLWLTPFPQYVQDDWRNLSRRLLGRIDEHWSVWSDWYEAQLAGPTTLSEREEIARVSLPNDVWAQRATVANPIIARLDA